MQVCLLFSDIWDSRPIAILGGEGLKPYELGLWSHSQGLKSQPENEAKALHRLAEEPAIENCDVKIL